MDDPWLDIECDWHSEPFPSPEALAAATRLVVATRIAGFPPEDAQRGYWPTVRLFWDSGRTEVEVFPHKFELYFESMSETDGRCPILEFDASEPSVLDTLLSEICRVRSSRTG
jgi:hypothetical protein